MAHIGRLESTGFNERHPIADIAEPMRIGFKHSARRNVGGAITPSLFYEWSLSVRQGSWRLLHVHGDLPCELRSVGLVESVRELHNQLVLPRR